MRWGARHCPPRRGGGHNFPLPVTQAPAAFQPQRPRPPPYLMAGLLGEIERPRALLWARLTMRINRAALRALSDR